MHKRVTEATAYLFGLHLMVCSLMHSGGVLDFGPDLVQMLLARRMEAGTWCCLIRPLLDKSVIYSGVRVHLYS
jgi:hypothetical protein